MGNVETTMSPVESLVEMVHRRALELPEIQRGYVWYRSQVRDLLDSLYRGYPVGTILIWQTDQPVHAQPLATRHGDGALEPVRFLLDGQQRLTSLTKVFKDGEPDIRFNLETEEFQVSNAAIRRDPRWVPVSEVFQKGAIAVAMERGLIQGPDAQTVLNRLNRLEHIRTYQVPVHVLKGFDYEEVTDIFVRVNSKGTRLREAELAIARLAFRIPGMVTEQLKAFEEELDAVGYDIDLRFLVRCLTAVATGQSRFGPLGNVAEAELRAAWTRTRKAVEHFLNLLNRNLGIESIDWLPSINAIVVPVAYLARVGARDPDVNGLLRWFLLSSTWQRYAVSAETTLDQDLRALNEPHPFRALEEDLHRRIGRVEVTAADLDDAGVTSPFFLVTYLACRQRGATDWWTGVKLSSTNLGTAHTLELHHIFPKAVIADKYPQRDVNELANLAFLSAAANREIGRKEPGQYLPGIARERLEQQFVPMDERLWTVDRFQDFLAARRELLAAGINEVFRALE
jgi:hypothetical protein